MNSRSTLRDRLEAKLLEAVAAKSIEKALRIEKALENIEQHINRKDQAWMLDSVPNEQEGETSSLPSSPSLAIIVLLRNALADITYSDRPRLTSEVYELALGFKSHDPDQSLREISRRHPITVEGLRIQVERIRQKYNLPKLAPHKRPEIKRRYAFTNGRDYHEKIA